MRLRLKILSVVYENIGNNKIKKFRKNKAKSIFINIDFIFFLCYSKINDCRYLKISIEINIAILYT